MMKNIKLDNIKWGSAEIYKYLCISKIKQISTVGSQCTAITIPQS